jgi:hypothetical protein
VIFSGDQPVITTTRETDQQWHIRHRDGRHVAVADRIEVIGRLIHTGPIPVIAVDHRSTQP